MEIKTSHETGCRNVEWASDSLLEHYASQLASAGEQQSPGAPTQREERPRVIVERGIDESINIVNSGNVDAFEVSLDTGANAGSAAQLVLESNHVCTPRCRVLR